MFPAKLSIATALVVLAVAQALAPAPETKLSDWVDQGKVILTARTNTPKPGPFSFEGVEYIKEPLDRLHPDDPAKRVTVIGGAQSVKSSIGQLWVASSVANNPKSFAIGLPSDGEVLKYNTYKLAPILEDSPDLKTRVRPVSTKSATGSSTRQKLLFNGASILIFNLSSPKELQMISTGNLILEEVANTLVDVGGRGSPVMQARERQAAYSVFGSKELMVSTPGEIGTCEITKAYEASDQRRFFGECPHCLCHFALEPEGFKSADKTWSHHFICPGCGSPLTEAERATFIRNGVWLPTFRSANSETNPQPPASVAKANLARWQARDIEGRQPGYYVWQAMCGLISWDKIATSIAEAKTPADLKALDQQTYGRAWDPSVEAMNWEELHRLREDYDHGVVPAGAEVVTAFTDVQGGYLQGTAYAWGPGGEWWVIDRWTLLGDTSGAEVWHALDEVARRTYRHQSGGQVSIAAFGLDTGFRTQNAYGFCRGRPTCFAMDGRPGWKIPMLGKGKVVKVIQNGRKVGSVKLWPTGTWELKSLLAWSLKRSTEAGYNVRLQGRGHWSRAEDENWAQQITAEALHEEKNEKTGQVDRWWKKLRPNEETDIWVGARALAWNLGVGAAKRGEGDATNWAALAADRAAAPQSDLFVAAATPGIAAPVEAAVVTPPAAVKTGGWFSHRKA